MEIIRTELRRRWTREEKMAAAAACFEPGAIVTGVARAIGVNPSMVFAGESNSAPSWVFQKNGLRWPLRPSLCLRMRQ